jgi:hypothetical protein
MEGPDTLGVSCINDVNTGEYYQTVPIPPSLDYQIDTIVMLHMDAEQKAIIKSLKRMIFSKERLKVWYEVYLTVFVLLSTTEYVYQAQQKYKQRHQCTVRSLCFPFPFTFPFPPSPASPKPP